jgi:hypothetical protein
MSTQKAKFELFARLQELGFTYDEAAALRRIEMTLQRWAERECGDGSDWVIERDEVTGKPFNVYHGEGRARRYAIPDREAGALRRLKVIVDSRNSRNRLVAPDNYVTAYHQGDCRGCMLYLLTREQLTDRQTGELLPIDQYYNRGLAVCA